MRTVIAILFTISLALPIQSFAMQVFAANEGYPIVFKISLKDITRLKVQNAKIEKVRVNKGLVTMEPDPQHNELYIRVIAPVRNISVFLTTDAGQTYTLMMQPEDIPSTTVVLRAAGMTAGATSAAGKEDYRNHIKQRMLAMTTDVIGDADIEEVGIPVSLWKDTQFVLRRRYKWDDYVGEIYHLTNQGKKHIDMLEREFFRTGVVAVTVDQLRLSKGETTSVFVLKRKDFE